MPEATDENGLLYTSDVARRLGWNVRKVQRAITTGAIPIVGRNRRHEALIAPEAVEALAEQVAQSSD